MRYLLFMGGLLIFLIACSGISGMSGAECKTDDECITGGCSGVICTAKSAPPLVTTCEFLNEYQCYRDIDCGCVKNQCQWKETSEFEQCVTEKRAEARAAGQISG